MTEIKLSNKSFVKIDLDELLEWFRNSNIVEWDVKASVEDSGPTLVFQYPEDAIAFRLKYGA